MLIAVEVKLYREGLATLLAQQPGIDLVGTATNVPGVVESAQALRPAVILLDAGFPDSLPAVRTLFEVVPAAKVVALALAESDPEVISYAQAGMSGYVTRNGSLEQLVETIRSVANGEFLCSPRVAAALLRRIAMIPLSGVQRLGMLTQRELEITGLIGDGLSNKEIANRLTIEVSTVKNHVHHVLEKLHVARRSQIAARLRDSTAMHRPHWAPLARGI